MPHGGDGRSYKTAADPGEGPGALDTSPPPPPPSDLTLAFETEILTSTGSYTTF